MTERFDRNMAAFKLDLLEMGSKVALQLSSTYEGMLNDDKEILKQVMIDDDSVDDFEKHLQRESLNMILLEHPVAKDFKFLTATIKMITDLERIGDHAEDISNLCLQFNNREILKLDEIYKMFELAIVMVKESMKAYFSKDLQLAKKCMVLDDKLDKMFNSAKKSLTTQVNQDTMLIEDLLTVLLVAKYLERIGDHAVNICEWTSFSLGV